MSKIFHFFKIFFFGDSEKGLIGTFTYYIPGPPERKNGYQEKEFDTTLTQLLQKGFKVLSFHTQTHQSANQSGMWVIFLLKGRKKLWEEDILSNKDNKLSIIQSDSPT